MLDNRVLRVGGGAAMAGAVIALIFNILHPRSGAALDDAAAELELVAENGGWLFIHYMLGLSIALGLVAILVIGRSFPEQPAASWGLVAAGVGIGSTAILFATVLLDGFGMDRLAAAGADAAGVEVLQAVTFALLTGAIGSYFGLTPLLFGIAMLLGATYPRWVAYLALAGGGVGFLTGSIQWFTGPTTFTINVMFLISSLLFTLWVFFAGWTLWQRTAGVPAAAAAGPTK